MNQVDLDIMLLGKTGVGKSRTGNSILDRKAFRSSGETKSATNKSQKEITRLDDGRILRVVNTPGVGDTRETTKEENLMTAINEAIVSNPMGYHALIIVLRFGSRFTQEDIDTMQFLKKVFGNNFVKKYCIVVMSCGDQFLHAVEVGDIEGSFTDWCKKQDSDFQTLFKEVEGRVLLFNNTLKDRKEKDKQRNELVAMIDGLVLGRRRYTNTKIEKARQELEKQIHQEKTSKLALEVQDEMDQVDLDIMLLGKTGVGKSKTGNSILDRKAFDSSVAMQSETIKSQKEITRLDDGRILRVVDTPGVGDTRETTKEEKIFMTAIDKAIVFNPMGYHALIIVLRFGSRFTQEDIDTMQFLKKVFGENFVKKYCIVVMSCGDQFLHAVEEGDIEESFTDWCKKQNSEFQTLFKEVEGRVLLFNNTLKDKKEKDKQRDELVAMIDGLVAGGRRYTNTKLEKARQELEKQIYQKKISKLALVVQGKISLILQENNRIQEIDNVDTSLYEKTRLIDQICSIQKRIDQEKVQSVELLRLCSVVIDARHHIEQELIILQTKKDLENKKNAEKDQALREIKEQVEELRNDNKKLMEKYKKVRDENNRSWFTKLWDSLRSFLFGKSLTSQ